MMILGPVVRDEHEFMIVRYPDFGDGFVDLHCGQEIHMLFDNFNGPVYVSIGRC